MCVVGFDVQNINGFIFNLSSLNASVSRKVISFSDISAVNLMAGWNFCGHVSRLVTVLYFLVFFFRSLDLHVGKKQRRPERTGSQGACVAVVSFPNALAFFSAFFFSLFMTVIQISSLRRVNNQRGLFLPYVY